MRIGVLVCHLSSHYASMLCSGIQRAAAELGASVFLFPGACADDCYVLADSVQQNGSQNAIFTYAAHCCPDVLIVSLGSIANCYDQSGEEFLRQFTGIPTIVLETRQPGYRCVTIDNTAGFSALLRHLILEHGYRRIGYVDGKANNYDALERKRVFLQTMRSHGLPVEDRMIVRGDFNIHCEAAISRLLDDNPDLQAICCANDDMAVGAYHELTRRGLLVGRDIALTGFDDSELAGTIHPELSTVRTNTYELGQAAVREALLLLQDKPQQIFEVASVFVRRASCGCAEQQSELNHVLTVKETSQTEYLRVARAMAQLSLRRVPGALLQDHLVDLFYQIVMHLNENTLRNHDAAYSVETLLSLLHNMFAPTLFSYLSCEGVQTALNVLMETQLARLTSKNGRILLLQALSRLNRYISSMARENVQTENEELKQSAWLSSYIVSDALELEERESVCREICEKVQQLGARGCYLYLFEKPVAVAEHSVCSAASRARLTAWCDEMGFHAESGASAPLLRPDQFLRSSALPQDRPVFIMTFCLCTGSEQHGMLLCECDLRDFQSMYLASLQASAALKLTLLMEQQAEMLHTISMKKEMLLLLSTQDELTGVLNRRGFLDGMQQMLATHAGEDAALFYLDLDHLKTINDKFGHGSGDYALRTLTQMVQSCLQSGDLFGRMGGDEFALFRLMPLEAVEPFTEKLHHAFDAADLALQVPFHVNASVGCKTLVCDPGCDLHAVLSAADAVLYSDKQRKRASVLRTQEETN